MTPFSKTVLLISKNFVPDDKDIIADDKPVCRLLGSTSCRSEFVPVQRHTVNHVF